MDVLSISSPQFSQTLTPKLPHNFSKKPISYCSTSSRTPSFKSLSLQTPTPSFAAKPQAANHSVLISSASQAPEAARRGADGDVMGLLLRERIVFLGTDIDDFVADSIISQLLLLDAQDPKKDIKLFINSTGGSLSATLGIYDVVQLVRADVSTIALGIAASTAAIILGGGTKGKRFAMPNTRIMIHQPMGGTSGEAMDVEIAAREVMNNLANVTRIISRSTGRPYKQVKKDIDRDRYMSPMEAAEYGLIDGVIDEDSIIPLQPVPDPDKVKPREGLMEVYENPDKFFKPDIPDDEIY